MSRSDPSIHPKMSHWASGKWVHGKWKWGSKSEQKATMRKSLEQIWTVRFALSPTQIILPPSLYTFTSNYWNITAPHYVLKPIHHTNRESDIEIEAKTEKLTMHKRWRDVLWEEKYGTKSRQFSAFKIWRNRPSAQEKDELSGPKKGLFTKRTTTDRKVKSCEMRERAVWMASL